MSRKGEIGESSTNHIHRKEDEMKRDPLWYTITDWVTRIIISIVIQKLEGPPVFPCDLGLFSSDNFVPVQAGFFQQT